MVASCWIMVVGVGLLDLRSVAVHQALSTCITSITSRVVCCSSLCQLHSSCSLYSPSPSRSVFSTTVTQLASSLPVMTLGAVSFAAEDDITPGRTSYDILALPQTATQSDIQRAYKQLATRYHPDRMKDGNTAHFRAITAAYELIANPVNRAIYDMECGLVEATPEHLSHIHRLRRVEAMQALRLMFAKCHAVTQHEMASGGLLILQAQYGQLDSPQHILDVTMQLQTAVQDGMLVVKGGSSKSWLDGFYDPTEGGTNVLDVVYKVDGAMYRAVVGDEDELILPHANHRMPASAVRQWERRYTLRAVDLTEQAVKRRRRYIAAASIVAAVSVGAVVYYRHSSRGKPGVAVSGTSAEGGQSWVSGLGGVVGRGSEQVREVVMQWLALLSQWTAICLQHLPSAVRDSPVVKQLGAGLVPSNSLQWLGEKMPQLRLVSSPAV